MKNDQKLSEKWLQSTFISFPNLAESIEIQSGEVLIIGATVLHFYRDQAWINFARRTGDIDLSVGFTPGSHVYSQIKDKLIEGGYAEDPEMKYRLQKPIKGLTFGEITIDLLVHPRDAIDETHARDLMGVGEEWNFDGIRAGLNEKISINAKVSIPNPMGFIGLKLYSYQGDPRRVRDIVDVIDVIRAFVEKANHYELADVWQKMSNNGGRSIPFVKAALLELANSESTVWDLSRARQEFYLRGYSEEDVDYDINEVVSEFNDGVGI